MIICGMGHAEIMSFTINLGAICFSLAYQTCICFLVCRRLWTNESRQLPQESCAGWSWGPDWHLGHCGSGGLCCYQRQLLPQWRRLSLCLLHHRTGILCCYCRLQVGFICFVQKSNKELIIFFFFFIANSVMCWNGSKSSVCLLFLFFFLFIAFVFMTGWYPGHRPHMAGVGNGTI